MADPQFPNPVIVPEVPGGAGGVEVNPQAPGGVSSTSPDAPSLVSPDKSSGGTSGGTGMAPMLPAAVKWIGALFLLWVVLTALSEHGDPNAKKIGTALAGLVLLGALYNLGPDRPDGTPGALTNAKKLITG